MHAKLLQMCLTLCDPMDYSLPGSSVHGISLARILEWVVISSSRGSSQPRVGTHVSYVSCIWSEITFSFERLTCVVGQTSNYQTFAHLINVIYLPPL